MFNSGILTSITSVLAFVILVIPGFFAIRKNIIKSIHIDGLSAILVNFIWPAMVIDAMVSTELNDEMRKSVIYAIIVCVICYGVSTIFAFLYVKLRGVDVSKSGIMRFGIILNNTGFIGMPLINVVFGAKGLIIAAMAELACDAFIFTIGVFLMNDNGGFDKGAVLNPGFLSVFVGLFLLFTGIKLPEIISQPISILGQCTTGVAMFIIGAQLGEAKLKDLFKDRLCFEVTFFRLVLIPLILMGVLYCFFRNNAYANTILIIMFAMPSASSTAIFARQYKRDYHFATKCVMLSTVLSVVTTPIWLVVTGL